MATNTRVNGITIWPTDKVNSGMLMGIIMKDSGLMTKRRDKDCIQPVMVANILDNGLTTYSTAKVRRLGPTSHIMKVSIRKEQSTEKAYTSTPTVAPTMANGPITK